MKQGFLRLTQSIGILALAVAAAAYAQPAGKDPAPTSAMPAAGSVAGASQGPGITLPQPAADAPVHDELRALQKAMEDALNNRDLDALLANVDDKLVFTAMNAESGYGKAHVRDYFNRMLTGPDKIVDAIQVDFIPDGLATFYGPDVAVSAGKAASHYDLTNGMKFDVTARWTATLVRKDGRWLVASFHYSTNMFKNPVLDAQRKWLTIAGVGGALVLGVLGFILGRRSGRRRA
ncbi:MAG TPA: nuclear transport factor 2 family protein [Steroidobacteraceae bacterium]|nr:nuclear transport factor 2 family protein [Steroidobacteraceae bacterium]